MRIGFFTDTFMPQTNGVVTALCDFGAELARRRHNVSVFCPRTRLKTHNGMRVYSYPSLSFRPYPEFCIGLPVSTRNVPPLDVVHCHGPFSLGVFGLRVAQKQSVPAVATFHTLLPEYVQYLTRFRFPKRWLQKFAWAYCRQHYNQYDLVTTPSEYIKKQLEKHGVKKPITVVPNSVNLKFFKPAAKQKARKKLGLPADGRVFLYLGRLGFEKNVDVLIRAAAGLDCLLVIAGRGPAEKDLRIIAERTGADNIRFDGFIPTPLLPYYYSAADAFVTASTSETQCITAVEAMACGAPVIAADSLALPEIVKNSKNGFLFRTQSQLRRLLTEFKPSQRMRRAAEKTAHKFSTKNCTDRLEKAYELAQEVKSYRFS